MFYIGDLMSHQMLTQSGVEFCDSSIEDCGLAEQEIFLRPDGTDFGMLLLIYIGQVAAPILSLATALIVFPYDDVSYEIFL